VVTLKFRSLLLLTGSILDNWLVVADTTSPFSADETLTYEPAKRISGAIEETLETGVPKPITARLERMVRPGGEQIIRLLAVKYRELVDAAAPDGN
jgi:hypothetical protein